MTDDQHDTIAFLSDAASYGPGVERVDLVETHVSLVFLAGERAYKLKRAVTLPYLDFSTAERRRQACQAELSLNRRTAPELYLEVRRLARTAAGGIAFAEEGPAVDWVVVMRRFEQQQLLDAMAATGELGPRLTDALADHIAQFHAAAEKRPGQGGAAALAEVIETNHRCLVAARRAVLERRLIDALREASLAGLAGAAPLLDARRDAGKVRRCHGDLHLRNICLIDGEPVLFDCLEFSDELASIDVLYDLAFLLMDLELRGLGDLANRVLNRYLDRSGEDDGLAAMPLFLSLRAAIRAHVTATALETAAEDAAPAIAETARRYLGLAHRALRPEPPRLVAIGGLSGTGKSTLALALAPALGPLPGARVLRSDVLRKLLCGVEPEAPLPESAYTAAASRRVYHLLRLKAATALAAGYAVVIDAVSLTPAERRSFADAARAAGVPFTGLWLDAPAATMRRRLRTRRHDASDATPAVLARQLDRDPGPVDWLRIDSGGGPDATLAAARRAVAAASGSSTISGSADRRSHRRASARRGCRRRSSWCP
jgi:hypothetical protein